MSQSLNRSQYDHLVRSIANSRKKPEAEVQALIDQGPFQPEDALRVGLMDEVAYEDELDDLVDDLRGADYVDAEDYARGSWEATGVRPRAKIAIMPATGVTKARRTSID